MVALPAQAVAGNPLVLLGCWPNSALRTRARLKPKRRTRRRDATAKAGAPMDLEGERLSGLFTATCAHCAIDRERRFAPSANAAPRFQLWRARGTTGDPLGPRGAVRASIQETC